MLTAKDGLCHGDYTPKNVLTHDRGFTLVDYETAYCGDPTMDLGLCLAHLVLKAVHRPDLRARYFSLIRAFWAGYRGSVEFVPVEEWESDEPAPSDPAGLALDDFDLGSAVFSDAEPPPPPPPPPG